MLSESDLSERISVVSEAEDGIDGLKKLQEVAVDLLFLDINMPELDGFGVLERIEPESRPIVIFTTAYDEYAIKAFEENAVDYLLKPMSQERLDQAIRRAEKLYDAPHAKEAREEHLGRLLDWLDAKTFPDDKSSSRAIDEEKTEHLKQISIPFRDRILIVPVERLVSAEISEGITRLVLLDAEDEAPKRSNSLREHIVSYTLDTLDANLDPRQFMRVHRAAIVQIPLITEMIPWFSGRYKLVMKGGHEVIASRERSKLLKERLMM